MARNKLPREITFGNLLFPWEAQDALLVERFYDVRGYSSLAL